jgi:hypothetical protein
MYELIMKINYGKLRRVQVCYHLLALDKHLPANRRPLAASTNSSNGRDNGQTAETGKIDHEKK